MPSTLSEKDLELLGYSEITEVPLEDLPSEAWKFYEATTIAGVSKVTHKFAYLPSTATIQQARWLAKRVTADSDLYLVTPKSGIDSKTIHKVFGGDVNHSIFEDLIWERLDFLFSDYLAGLSDGISRERVYVQQRSETATNADDRLDRDVYNFLRGVSPGGKLHVISASAGVGKTTLARRVIKELAETYKRNKIIPTYVEASHWSKLQIDTIDDLWSVIQNSIGVFSRGLFIREDLFEHALRQGYIVFIFDGFDELCTQRHSRFVARDMLNQLLGLVEENNARIIITTRTLFWDSEIGETPLNTTIHLLRPFESTQAKDYFKKFFPNQQAEYSRAISIYRRLVQQSLRPREQGGGRAQFANLPICVGLIAQFVSDGGQLLDITEDGTLIEQFLLQILERECARQGLKTLAKIQLEALIDIAVYCAQEDRPDVESELLVASGFNETDILRLGSHPLINTKDGASFSFAYEFLQSYLLAIYLYRVLLSPYRENPTVSCLFAREANGKGFIIEHLVELLGDRDVPTIGTYFHELPRASALTKSFIFHILKALAETSTTTTSAKERTNYVFSALIADKIIEPRKISNLYITGTIDRFNLSGYNFIGCTFHDVNFLNCSANEETRFSACKFSGDLEFLDCRGSEWANIILDQDCILEPPTHLVWEGILGSSNGSKKDHVRDALLLALNKFWQHGRFKGSIRQEDWHKGTLGHSIYCEKLLREMLRQHLLSEVKIPGTAKGGYAFNRDALSDLQSFMDNRMVVGGIKRVFDALTE
ncbi:NACHT domain-containing protein [Synechococcus sp. FACHB-909]|uniref:NACHT domain-containing protein n=1 Tax=Synechococcus sp. FACHB-909 TaxID=2692863 RepID=UPI001682DDD7|nr:NACHT domain-containing protein [Synechococcus sp. FACHB-909]MBD2720239.1 NACHT domain-containing protein [Synechococcus sp. FACHB-909]